MSSIPHSRVLVVGGSGNVGRLILPFLAKEFSLTIFDLRPPAKGPWKFIRGDVQNRRAIDKAAKGMDALIYMAIGPWNPENIDSSYDVNVKGLHIALEAAKSAGIKRVVYTSTISVHDGYAVVNHDGYNDLTTGCLDHEGVPPYAKTVYGLTKRLSEQVCQFFYERYGLPILVLRLCKPVSAEEKKTKPFQGLVDSRTEASDLARAIISSLNSTHKEFEIIYVTGDQTGSAYPHEKAKTVLGWQAHAKTFECESAKKNDDAIDQSYDALLRARFPERYEDLFRSALLKEDAAISAWTRYRAAHSLLDIKKDFEGEFYPLLPMMYRNLEGHIQSTALPSKYLSVYPDTLKRNQTLINEAARAIKSFLEAGIEVLVLKGAALLVTHYQDFGLRPIEDVGVAVKAEQLLEATEILKENGWSFHQAVSGSWEFINASGNKLDVHWFAGTDAWNRSLPIVIQGIPARALDSTDHLGLICGIYKWNMLWVADAFKLINDPLHHINWERLITNKKSPLQILALRTALHYLSAVLGADVPKKILTDLTRQKISRRDYISFITAVCPANVEAVNPLAWLATIWSYYESTVPSNNFLTSLSEFPLYLRYRWNTKRWWQFPFAAAERLIARMFN